MFKKCVPFRSLIGGHLLTYNPVWQAHIFKIINPHQNYRRDKCHLQPLMWSNLKRTCSLHGKRPPADSVKKVTAHVARDSQDPCEEHTSDEEMADDAVTNSEVANDIIRGVLSVLCPNSSPYYALILICTMT